MDVYHGGNIWVKNKNETRLAALTVNQAFLWDKQDIFIPAVYVGKAGAVLDVCAKIPTEDMKVFLKKWDKDRRQSLKLPEEYEQIEADNPSCREFTVAMSLDDTTLIHSMSSSIRWYPKEILLMENTNPDSEEEWKNEKQADEWMDAYGCDRNCCWYFERLSYNWKDNPILSPKKLSLAFQADFISITAGHFSTDGACDGKSIKTAHPVTGQEYTLTLHDCEQTWHSFAEIGAKGVSYPEYCQILSYDITPEIDRNLFDIRDCNQGDQPRIGNTQVESGASAIFLAGKSATPDKRMAASSLHFKPVSNVQWRIVFQIKPKNDLEISFPIHTIS